MSEQSYLGWLAEETVTSWWNDSAMADDINNALNHGAVGVTTNPVLVGGALSANESVWRDELEAVLQTGQNGEKPVDLTGLVVKKASDLLLPLYEETSGEQGYVCSQVNPANAGDRETMRAMVEKMRLFNKNVSVKLPATAAGLDVMGECIAEGINITMTVSFTLPQVLAIAERVKKAEEKAAAAGKKPGKCYAVIMIGRIDDYLRDVAADCNSGISEDDITKAGLAITKRAYKIFKEEGFSTTLMIAAMRGIYHITELAGADLILSIHPKFQKPIFANPPAKEVRIDAPVPQTAIDNLMKLEEFRKAYEPDGMKPEEFISFGAEQRTLSQFSEVGWKKIEAFSL